MTRGWCIALWCALCGLLCACGDLGEDFAYRGSRKLDDGDYYVSTVAWLQYLPVAFATRREAPGQSRTLRLVPLGVEGVPICATAPATRFIAVGSDGDYRVAVFDEATGKLDFFDQRCTRRGPSMTEVASFYYLGDDHFVVRGRDDAAFIVDPFADTVAMLGERVWTTGAQTVEYAYGENAPVQTAIWVLDGDVLELRDLEGRGMGPRYEGVLRFATHQGPQALSTRFIAFEDAEGVKVVQTEARAVLRGGDEIESEVAWGLVGACLPRFHDLPTPFDTIACPDDDCGALAGPSAGADLLLSTPWLAAFHPCDDRRLTFNQVLGDEVWEIAPDIDRYVVARTPVAGEPVVLYRAPGDDGALRRYYKRGQDEPLDMGVPVDLSLFVEESSIFPRMRIVTAEDAPRYGIWSPTDGFEPLLEQVLPSPNSTMVLHGFEAGLGTLSHCTTAGCRRLARDVPPEGFRQYETLERIGDGLTVHAYIHDVREPGEGGRLTAVRQRDQRVADIDEGVTSFAPIENGPARGIVYAVRGGEREGLWFAPR